MWNSKRFFRSAELNVKKEDWERLAAGLGEKRLWLKNNLAKSSQSCILMMALVFQLLVLKNK